MNTEDSPRRAGGTLPTCRPRKTTDNADPNVIANKPDAKAKSLHQVNVAGDHDLTPSHCDGRRIHSADVQPAGNRVDHVLVINGLAAGRFAELQKAIKARTLLLEQATDPGRDLANQGGLVLP
jgi:hypothetical protein